MASYQKESGGDCGGACVDASPASGQDSAASGTVKSPPTPASPAPAPAAAQPNTEGLSADALREMVAQLEQQITKQRAELKRAQFDLDMERGHVNILRHDNQQLRQAAVDLQQTAEEEEEYISNTLLKKIHGLKKEKGDLMQQVEREEEFLTNTLQRRLIKVQQEKIDIENALEQEQEAIVNRLQRQMDILTVGQQGGGAGPIPIAHTMRTSEPGSPAFLPSPSSASSSYKWRPGHGANSGSDVVKETFVEVLKAEVNAGRIRSADLERELIAKHNQATGYRRELIELRKKLNLPVEDLMAQAAAEETTPLGSVRFASPLPRTRSMSNASSVRAPDAAAAAAAAGSLNRARSSSGSFGRGSGNTSEPHTPYPGQTLVNPVPPRLRRISGPTPARSLNITNNH